jgi:hypothetical protein
MEAFLKIETYGVAPLIVPIEKNHAHSVTEFFKNSAHAYFSNGLSTENEKVFVIKEGWIFTVKQGVSL